MANYYSDHPEIGFYLIKTAGIINLCAYVGSVVLSARIGGRIYKKNQENK